MSNNPKLIDLSVYSSQLTGLDVSNNQKLQSLYLNHTPLASLDLSNNLELQLLSLWYCDLTSLDVSNNSALRELMLSYNQLSSLDVSNNPALTKLNIGSNLLTSLDLSNNPELTTLDLSYNKLTDLDVSNNPALTFLALNENQLTSLNVNDNPLLNELLLYSNPLTPEAQAYLAGLGFDGFYTDSGTDSGSCTGSGESPNEDFGFAGELSSVSPDVWFIDISNEVTVCSTAYVVVGVSDQDDDLKYVVLTWGNGRGEVKEVTGGISAGIIPDSFLIDYPQPGVYQVSVQAFDASGNKSDIITTQITVTE